MVQHISARVAWHNNGWNGHICKNPKENTYCIGQYSYPGNIIAKERDLDWEVEVAGCSCEKLDAIPPCIHSINAFGKEQLEAYSDPPEFFNDESKVKFWDLPASTIGVWPYEEMYSDEVKNPNGKGTIYDNHKRLELAKKFFSELSPDKSLIFYYSNYSNPFSENDEKKYVVVGVARLKSISDYLYYDDVSEENKQKYGGGFVWQMPISSHYPDQGFKLPYDLYLDNPEIIKKILFVPENDRNFKYGTRQISDDDALDLIENFLEIIENLIELGDQSENWASRREWLQSLIAELWQNRGAYPGLLKVLNYLDFHEGIQYFKQEVTNNNEKEAKDLIFSFLNGNTKSIPGVKLSTEDQKKILRRWSLKEDFERNLLSEILPRFDLQIDQIEKILSQNRHYHGIHANLNDIYENAYILSEEFMGDNPDDRISFNKIDHGIFPSPELGLKNLAEIDDWRRLRALCVERLKKEQKHTFIASTKIIHDINYKLSFLPDWKRHQFNERYFEVDNDDLSQALTFREENSKKYIYLNEVFEDERVIEKEVRELAKRPDIVFKFPVTEEHWHDFLYDNESTISIKNPEEYENAIKDQIKVCKKIFVKPICVISGAAGTGKTTIIKAIISAIEKAHGTGTSFQLLAPTGKAAERIREKTEKSASTIHSFLAQKGWLNENLTFKRIGGAKEEGKTTFIIDESSMLDLNLISTLFRAINWKTVQRLIFVGDPNQLPPIGRGRVFADIIEWLEEQNQESLGILNINVRQMENRLTDRGTGILDLASIYIRDNKIEDKANNKSYAEELLKRVQEGGEVDTDLRVLYWKNTDELESVLRNIIISDMEKDTGDQFDENKPYELWRNALKGDTESARADYQQIITPYRGELFGTDNLNFVLQTFLNGQNVENKGSIGGITIFDKVIQYRNRPKSDPYWAYNIVQRKNAKIEVYNGEIGFVKPHAYDMKKLGWDKFRINQFQVIFSRKKDYWIPFTSANQVEQNLELAYAISVHKAQGSEFERVYLILPKNKKSLLSTELLYTGITRSQRHLTLLVEEDISPFLTLRRPENSHILGINSSLFNFKPVPDEILTMFEWYEEGKIHKTLSDFMVRSKSEVIIANMLHEREIPFKYEVPLFAPDGTFYLPDFTIIWNGEEWYWEHLGLMDIEKYRNHWETKKLWYEEYFSGRLVTTDESGGLSKDAESIIENYFS